jgi:dsDNA-specific endonuclease/ATPase MutS2
MEKEIKDALNFMIGAVTTVKTESEKFLAEIESKVKELSEKGAQDTSEVSMNLRKYTEEAFKEIEKILSEAKTRFDEVKAKVESMLPKQQ